MTKSDELVKSQEIASPVIPANPGSGPGQAPESRKNKHFWTPAFAGVTALMTFYESINSNNLHFSFGLLYSSFVILRFAFKLLRMVPRSCRLEP